MKNINVFVYGTLLSKASNPAERFVNADLVGPAVIYGDIYDLGWYPGLKIPEVIDTFMDSEVHGELICIDEEALERLDAYEGAPDLYSRVKTVVFDLTHKEEVVAFTYAYNGNVHPEDRIPFGDWLGYDKVKETRDA